MVDDVNDNAPTFASSTYHARVPEDAPTGTDVLLVNASDADAAANAIIRWVPPALESLAESGGPGLA